MGAKDDELRRIAAAGRFDVPALSELRNALIALAATINRVAASPGWTGLSADAASDRMIDLRNRYFAIEKLAGLLQSHLDAANAVRERALERHAALPGTRAPDWVHGTLEAFDFPGIPQPVDVAQGGLAIIENYLAGEREKAAAAIVAEYEEGLSGPASSTRLLADDIEGQAKRGSDPEVSDPDDGDAGVTTGSGYPPGGHSSGGSYTSWPGSSAPFSGYVDPDVQVGVDDPGTGVNPGAPGTSTPGLGGGGAGAALPAGAGAGAGVALTGASTAAAMKLGAGAGMGGAGLANRPGAGGLLGAGAAGAPGAGTVAKSSSVGPRGTGSGLLGGGGTAAGAGGSTSGDKKRRAAGKGLGGPIAPKLDDDDEYLPQAPGARAGERGGPTEEVDALDPDA